ncbi:hypothetical protein L2E82_17950 [Cichorium intybus]|uniref:Uncharacterized protein n=1 Tax=Cichorium intybus TaxID=13427 RepID=A0ACB9FA37_CICIN|nr:hypothetical protein L2E82_17950 [Cichorium intybus]
MMTSFRPSSDEFEEPWNNVILQNHSLNDHLWTREYSSGYDSDETHCGDVLRVSTIWRFAVRDMRETVAMGVIKIQECGEKGSDLSCCWTSHPQEDDDVKQAAADLLTPLWKL